MANHTLLRFSATLLFIGVVITTLLNFVHPGGASTDKAQFILYASSSSWAAIHLGQFIGEAVLIAGLLVFFFALGGLQGTPRWLGFFGAMAAGVALALAGVVYAVDGVALKQAVDAWISAPAAEQGARFASAEAIRWLEWGTRSYQNYMFGLSLVLFAIAIVWTARITRPIGYVMGVIGLGYIVVGWLQGTQGLQSETIFFIGGITYFLLLPVWSIWLLIVAWRRKESVQAAPV